VSRSTERSKLLRDQCKVLQEYGLSNDLRFAGGNDSGRTPLTVQENLKSRK
jgi:hypothetical protein